MVGCRAAVPADVLLVVRVQRLLLVGIQMAGVGDIGRILDDILVVRQHQVVTGEGCTVQRGEVFLHPEKPGVDGDPVRLAGLVVEVDLSDRTDLVTFRVDCIATDVDIGVDGVRHVLLLVGGCRFGGWIWLLRQKNKLSRLVPLLRGLLHGFLGFLGLILDVGSRRGRVVLDRGDGVGRGRSSPRPVPACAGSCRLPATFFAVSVRSSTSGCAVSLTACAACCSGRLAGNSDDTRSPAPKAISPAATGEPCALRATPDGRIGHRVTHRRGHLVAGARRVGGAAQHRVLHRCCRPADPAGLPARNAAGVHLVAECIDVVAEFGAGAFDFQADLFRITAHGPFL